MENEQKHITNQKDNVTKELKDKIRSKIDVAKFFAGFITLFIGLLLRDGEVKHLLPKFGILFIVASLILCVLSIFAYDHMLWPKEHWPLYKDEEQSTEEDYQKKLEKEMLRSWWSLFMPGVICFGFGVSLILLRSLGLSESYKLTQLGNWPGWNLLLLILFMVVFTLPFWLWRSMWPDFEKSEKKKKDEK